jgi:nicotinate-nucleotide adenylyltransferase
VSVPDLRGALAMFGGTFDPIHVAHLAVAEAARDSLGLAAVRFIPAGEPPHKRGRRITPASHRLAMVGLAIADNPGFEVSTIEIEREGPSYTVDTLEALRAERLAAGLDPRLALLISSEAFAELPTWREPARIVELATIVVAPRDGYADATDAARAELERAIPGAPLRVVVLDGPRMRLSASELRARAAAGRSVRYLVPDAVAAYIGDHALYRDHR